jgi:hypothetical protein
MRLNEVQENFKHNMIDPARAPEGFTDLFVHDDISVADRLEVYRDHVMASLAKVMAATYPLIAQLAGDDFLSAAAHRYIRENLPERGNLNLYGATFGDFLERYEPAQVTPYLPDIARMEWAKNEAYYARDDAPFDTARLQAIAPENMEHLTFSFRDSVRLVRSDFPLVALRDYCAAAAEAPDAPTPDLEAGPVHLLIFRPELRIYVLEVPAAEFLFLQQIRDGKTLGEAAVTVLDFFPNFILEDTLKKHFGLGTFRNFRLGIKEG